MRNARDLWITKWVRKGDEEERFFAGTSYRQKKEEARAAWKALPQQEKRAVVVELGAEPPLQPKARLPPARESGAEGDKISKNGCIGYLLTYNFPVEETSDSEVTAAMKRIDDSDRESQGFEEAVAALANLAFVVAWWQRFLQWFQDLFEASQRTEASVQLELSLASEDRGRWHAHAFLSSLKGGQRHRLGSAKASGAS